MEFNKNLMSAAFENMDWGVSLREQAVTYRGPLQGDATRLEREYQERGKAHEFPLFNFNR